MTAYSFRSRAVVLRTLLTSALTLAGFTLTACSQKTQLPQISAQAAGHAITARIAGQGARVEDHAEGARLGSEFGEVTIERTRLRIEGAGWVRIAEGAPVTLSIERGRIDVKAGKVSASRTVSH
jgi:hypothetical protein